MCRVAITHAPVIVQAFASHMPDGLVRTMNEHFASWFRSSTSNMSNTINTSNYINDNENYTPPSSPPNDTDTVSLNFHRENSLISAAAQEWDIITNNESFNTNNRITNLMLLNRNYDLPNNWTFTPFTTLYTLNTNYTLNRNIEFAERWSPNQRKRFRRVIIYLDDNGITNEIQSLENNMFSRFSSLIPFSEIGLRNNRYSIGAYTLDNDYNEPLNNTSRNITLICKGVWTHNGQVGCRWFVNGLYN